MDTLLEKIAIGAPLKDVFHGVVEAITNRLTNTICTISVIDTQQRQRLGLQIAPHLPDELSQFIDGILIDEAISPCGKAACLKKIVIADEIAKSPFSPRYRAIAAKFNLRACWSIPIMGRQDQILGTLGLYHQGVRSPTTAELDGISQVARLAGIAIERHQADEQLRRSESLLLELQQLAKVGHWAFDIPTQTITWSPQMFRMYGLDPASTAPSYPEYLAMLREEDRQTLQQCVEQAIVDGTPYMVEFSVTRPDGKVCHHECRAETERDAQGQVVRLFGTSLDITERKQADLALKSLIVDTAATTGQDFFPALVRNIATALQVSYALVSKLTDDDYLEVIAAWGEGCLLPTFTYKVESPNQQPCSKALQQGKIYCDQSVNYDFPNDEFLIERNITSYLGVALHNSQGAVIGLLCIFDAKPIQRPQYSEQLLQVFAARCAAELERQHAQIELEKLNQDLEVKVEVRTAELQASRAYYQGILSDQTELICRFAPDGTLTFVNDAYCQHFKKSPDELFGQCFFSMLPEVVQGLLLDSLEGLSIDKPVDICEYFIPTPRGEFCWHQWTHRALFDEAGQFLEYQAVGRDITDRKQAEQALENLIAGTAATVGQDFFPALVQYISDALNVSYVFVAARTQPDEMTILAFWPNDILPLGWSYNPSETPCQKVLDEGRLYCEHSVQAMFPKDDALVELDAQSCLGVAIRNTQGEIIGDLCIFHTDLIQNPQRAEQILKVFADRAGAEMERQWATTALEQLNQSLEAKVAERTVELRERELSLRASEERYASLAAAAPVGIFRTDVEGNCVYVNNRCCEICGREPEGLMGDQWEAALHAEDRDRVVAAWLQSIANDTLFQLEYRFQWPDGTARWVYTQSVPEMDDAGQVIGYVGTITDISDRKQAELALQNLVEGTAAKTGQDFFPALVEHIALTLNVSSATVAQFGEDELETIAVWNNGSLSQSQTHTLADTPCELVLKEGGYYCEQGIRNEFPDSLILAEMQAESYMGIALYDSQDHIIGVLFILDQSRILNPERAESLLRVFGARAAAELERQRSELAIKRQLATIEAAVDGIGILENGKYLYANRAYLNLFGFENIESLIGQSWQSLYPPAEIRRFEESILPQLTMNRVWQGEAVGARQDGSIFPQGISLTLTEEDLLISVCRDISDLKETQALIVHNSLHDPLTELPNRTLLLERIELAISRAKRMGDYRYAVLFIDLDRFKIINDSLGHAVGDQLLVTIAQRLKRRLREMDLVARLGGDEFILLVENVDGVDDVIQVTERILNDFKEPILINGRSIFASFSVGIVVGDQSYNNATDLIRDADIAMYRAKERQGSSYSFFDSAMHLQAINRLTLETDLRKALAREEFVIHYQPIIDLNECRLIGFEVLVRWQHPSRGLTYPDEFIPIAEEIGLVEQIDAWVMHHACQQIATWNRQFPGEDFLKASINLSVCDLRRGTLIQNIDDVLEETQLPGSSITLEITETMLIEDIEQTINVLSQIAARQVQLSIDDFGTGYSSLNYLHRLPVHSLKIDRSFISELDPEHRNSKVASTILTLSNQLGLSTVAEGIETLQQLQYLRELGCQLGQGYFFSPPLSPEDVEERFFSAAKQCSMRVSASLKKSI